MKKILLIGASSAIARALAAELNNADYELISLSRQMPEAPFNEFHSITDLSQDELPKIEGVIDGLVYFPGSINLKPFRSLKKQDFMNDLEINLFGAIKSIQAYLSNLQLSQSASIVLFSSVAVQAGMSFHASVAISKGAIEGLTRSLAAEFAPKIRVNCIAPSLTDTPMANKFINTPEKLEASGNRHPLKRIGSSKDIAQAAAFLLSDKSTWISGQIIGVDGGLSSIKM